MSDNRDMNDNRVVRPTDQIGAILDLDQQVQQLLRVRRPNSGLQLNMPVGSVRALFALEGGQVRTPGGIADLLNISRTTITGVLDRLENEGLIARAIDLADRRSFVVTLTEAGHTLLRQMDAARREPLSQALEQLNQADLQALDQGLRALLIAMREYQVARGPVRP